MYENNVLDSHEDGLGKHVKLFPLLPKHDSLWVLETFESERRNNQLLVIITDCHGAQWVCVFCSDIVHVHLDGGRQSALEAIKGLDWILESIENFMQWTDKTVQLTVVHNKDIDHSPIPPATQRP